MAKPIGLSEAEVVLGYDTEMVKGGWKTTHH